MDLFDLIESYLWDACDGEDERHLEAISEEAMLKWASDVRNALERHNINLHFNEDGSVTR